MAALEDVDKERVRFHLLYPQLNQGAALSYGVAIDVSIQSVLEKVMDNMHADAIARVQQVADILDNIIDRMTTGALDRLQARKADVVVLNENETGDLKTEYAYWQHRLSVILAVPVNPAAPPGGGGLNMRVAR